MLACIGSQQLPDRHHQGPQRLQRSLPAICAVHLHARRCAQTHTRQSQNYWVPDPCFAR